MSGYTEPAIKLRKMIVAAIDDEKITPQEREDILMLAQEDGVVDNQEQALLKQLHDMIHNGSVKLVRGAV